MSPNDTWLMALPTPRLEFFADLCVEVAHPVDIGQVGKGRRRFIPITGGHASGDGWTARVLPGGADYQLITSDTRAELDAHYVLETDAGDLIYVRNRALRVAPPEVTARLIQGEPVDPGLVYFRCAPVLETASPAFGWVRERLFVGTGARHPDRVDMRFFELA
jgi:hypothetical protein